ncbi:hypothetical protein LWI28_024020 [Acer negundo]|uniref:Major facilitator superfamily (MFS) profile domain-containing protein n=1 Tax=Acer negundo TaxID=4023 RepID=A0AAD5JMQ3_ACENE|nr:hypothetical protein LWI28_024020 [Acer negundo]
MLLGGLIFFVGAAINASSVNIAMLIAANLVNYFTPRIKSGSGWRYSLGGAMVPALFIFISGFFLPNTPSMLEKGHNDKAREMLKRIRGVTDKEVEEEFNDILAASEASRQVKNPWRNIFKTVQTTADNGHSHSILSTVYRNQCGHVLRSGALQNNWVLLGALIGWKFGVTGAVTVLPKWYAILVVILICTYVAGFAWSWGPLGWLVPSEIFPLEIRSAAQSIVVSVNMFFTFIVAQLFLTLLVT